MVWPWWAVVMLSPVWLGMTYGGFKHGEAGQHWEGCRRWERHKDNNQTKEGTKVCNVGWNSSFGTVAIFVQERLAELTFVASMPGRIMNADDDTSCDLSDLAG